MKIFILLLASSLTMSGCCAQNTVCLTLEENPYLDDPALSEFSKYVQVLGCFELLAESSISDEKVLHAAAVAAELLDQNEDGVVDDQNVANALASGQALMPIFEEEGSIAEEMLFENYEGDGIGAVLYSDEINPNQPGYWGEDATVEEVLHTINSVGHVSVYPNAFSLSPGSSLLSAAMDVARGGQYLSVPDMYPKEAWYHYDDWTCDYECMAIEYLYWALVTKMGILDDPQTASGIADEWELYSAELLEETDVLIDQLISNAQFMLPLVAPDGNYCPQAVGISDGLESTVQIPHVVRVVDLMGRDTEPIPGMLMIHMYSDGHVKKQWVCPEY
ncbi:MAG: hypothetical protein OSA78_00025 [Flavobacteriales bacterium]|nr:hypothetical protein [Flavobacteriales bacterium]